MKTFFDLEEIPKKYSLEESSEICLLPIPYDETSTWMKGADKGPDAILNASPNLEFYDIETDSEVYQKGIYVAPAVTENSSPEKMTEEVYNSSKKFINKNKFIVGIGGEHSVSFGIIKAYSEAFEDLTILQFDAHADLREEYHCSKYNHACVMARAKEVGKILQVGIRSVGIEEKHNIDNEKVFYAHKIHSKKDWIKEVVKKLTKNVYITIDLDVFDPSIMPSTGTPEPGGMLWYDVLNCIKEVIRNSNLVGFDVVELCPNSSNLAPDFMAAKLIYKILSYKYYLMSS